MRDMEKEKRKLYKKDIENNKGRYIREILRSRDERHKIYNFLESRCLHIKKILIN